MHKLLNKVHWCVQESKHDTTERKDWTTVHHFKSWHIISLQIYHLTAFYLNPKLNIKNIILPNSDQMILLHSHEVSGSKTETRGWLSLMKYFYGLQYLFQVQSLKMRPSITNQGCLPFWESVRIQIVAALELQAFQLRLKIIPAY